MHKILQKSFFILAFLLLFFISCKRSPVKILNDISSHNLKVKLIPDEHKIIAIDSLQIEYLEQTNTVYFCLHQSLQIEKICVGNQQLKYEIVPRDKFDQILFSNRFNDSIQANLYKILLPQTLFPKNIQIWYQGVIANEHYADAGISSNTHTQQKYCCIEQERINLPGEKFWYPSLPSSKASYKITSLTPAGLPVITAGSLIFHEQRNDSLISIWEQKIPMENITITADDMDAHNSSLNDNFSQFNNYGNYFASYANEQRVRNFNYTRRYYLL